MIMQPKTFKTKLLIAVFALVTGSSVLVSLLVARQYSNSLYQKAIAEAENIAQVIALEATDNILINDLITLQKSLDHHLRSNPAVAYLFVVRDDRVLAHTFTHGIPVDLIKAHTTADEARFSTRKIISKAKQHYLDVAWPIFDGKAGILRVGLSEKPYRDQLKQLWVQIILLTVGILVLAQLAGLFFIKKVTQPLTLLANAVEKIDEGRLGHTVDISEQGEIGFLAQSFNRMLKRVNDYTRRLEEKNLQLDRAYKQVHTYFTISQEINSRTNLHAICDYLIAELKKIITCEVITVSVFTDDNSKLYNFSGNLPVIFSGKFAQNAYQFIENKSTLSFVSVDQIKDRFHLPSFETCVQAALFPIKFENQIIGVLSIACPGNCTCVTKELDIVDMLLAQASGAIRRAIAHEEEINQLKTRIERTSGFAGLVGKDVQMQIIYKLIEDVAPTDATVLIQGESGTGKELVARAIHDNSLRNKKPFVVINCSAYPSTLLESELFGHDKGAFTGAIRKKQGRFEQADGGTVFLDEIGEIPPTAQIKLLRILQNKKFERLGGEKTLKVDTRILAATNRDLQYEVKKGNFREDLYYRLNVIPINIPPLRKRRNDIPILARHFLKLFAEEQTKQDISISPEVMRLLLDHHWPGNVRELENTIEHATVIAKGIRIEVSDLPSIIQQAKPESSASASGKGSLIENEKQLLKDVLVECDWNKKESAARLGISRSTLYQKLKKYNITKPTIH